MRRVPHRCLIALTVIAACGSKPDKPTADEPPAPTVAPEDASVAVQPPAPVAITPAQRAAYRAQLRRGRALAGDKQWREASAAFTAALEAIAMDGRALSELGWAAFQAGDYPAARTANASAVRASTDSDVVAASLYNLGRVAEATGDQAAAADHYRASLRLRANKTVSARLATLGTASYDPWRIDPSHLPCSKPQSLDALCTCLQKTRAEEEDASADGAFECKRDIEAGARWGTVTTTHGYRDLYVQLVSKTAAGWSVAAVLAYVYNPGAFGIMEELDGVDVDERAIGERTVLWATTRKSRHDSDTGIEEEEWAKTELVTLCTVDAASGVTCLAQFATFEDYGRDRIDFGEGAVVIDAGPDDEDYHTPGLPISHKGRLAVTLGADGVAKVTLASGQKTSRLAPYVGEHKLW